MCDSIALRGGVTRTIDPRSERDQREQSMTSMRIFARCCCFAAAVDAAADRYTAGVAAAGVKRIDLEYCCWYCCSCFAVAAISVD